ncbi:MAG: amidohydrolase family protein [Acidiferrobacterales bacterium]|nr:amidohydrolase family protein [Acidiferrobacterales bacterium]
MTRLIGALIAALFSVTLSAQTTIIADALFDSESGKLKANPRIVVENNRIVSVGYGDIIPSGDLIDLTGHTLLPGLIDMHAHLTSSHSLHGYKRLSSTNTRSALRGVKHAKATLMAGITTVRNLGAPGFTDVDLRDAINDGDVLGPRMFVSGPSLGITGGHCDSNLLPYGINTPSEGVADGPWAAAKAVRRNIKFGADVIKICATGGVLSKGTKVGVQQYSYEEMQKIVEEAHRRGKTVAAHAHGTEGISAAIRAGVDSVEHASFIDDEGIKLAKKMGTHLSMDIYVTEYILGEGEKAGILEESLEKERKTGGLQRENFTKALKAGVPMVMGTDAGVYPHGDNLKQLSRMVTFGMTPVQALQAASINGARLLGQQDNIGVLKQGAFADIIAVKGNPLSDVSVLENVQFVMKNGKRVK